MKKWIGLLMALVIAGAGSWLFLSKRGDEGPYPGMGGDFTLQSADGPVSLSDFRGKVVLIYFGYTSCPDVCPTSLGALSAALKQLSPREMDRVQPIFISVDPERDTPGKMVEYVHYFHPKMIGVTGSIEQVRKVADRYGAYFRKAEVKDSSLGYAVDHSSVIYVVDEKGRLVDMIQHSGSPKTILEHLRRVLGTHSPE